MKGEKAIALHTIMCMVTLLGFFVAVAATHGVI